MVLVLPLMLFLVVLWTGLAGRRGPFTSRQMFENEAPLAASRFVMPPWLDTIVKIVQVSGFATFFVYMGLYFHYTYTLSTVPNQKAGEMYPLNMHGHLVYLNHQQNLRLEFWGWLAFFFAAIFGLLWVYIFYRQKGRLWPVR